MIKALAKLFFNKRFNTKVSEERTAFVFAFRRRAPAGKMMIGINEELSADRDKKIGYFAMFQCENNSLVASSMFREAAEWMKARNAAKMFGPDSITYDDFSKGVLLGRNHEKAFFLNPMNPAYFDSLLLESGLSKHRDHYAYFSTVQTILQIKALERIHTNTVTIKSPDFSDKALIDDMYSILSHEIPDALDLLTNPSKEDIQGVVNYLSMITASRYVKIAYADTVPVGILFAIPNYNEVLRYNSTWVSGVLSLLFKKRIRSARIIFAYIIPEYQRKMVSLQLIKALLLEMSHNKCERIEISTVDERNSLCVRSLEKVIPAPTRVYREYVMDIA